MIALLMILLAAIAAPLPAAARSLAAVKEGGAITVCAHPNSLPFASKDGKQHGFQIELAEALAHRLGVSLTRDWIITGYDLARTDCDIVMDSIADPEAQADSGLRLSKPYRRSGVALAVPMSVKTLVSLKDFDGHGKIGVMAGSIAAMTLGRRGIETVPDLFEDELLTMLVNHEINAAAVTPTSVGYYNLTHRHPKLRLVYAFDDEPNLSWNVAVGMRRPDQALKEAIDKAIDGLLADGTIKRIYARYGVELRPPK
jgi:polar amino acid transport system substrate-binding protein